MRDVFIFMRGAIALKMLVVGAAAVWHQADHPSAATFEEERLKRHNGGEQNLKAPSASVASDPGNGASDAGEGFNAGAYAFFGDPSSSGLELELGGLEEDAGGVPALDDEGGVKGLEGEEEVDIEELRDEDNEQQVAQAFAKVSAAILRRTHSKRSRCRFVLLDWCEPCFLWHAGENLANCLTSMSMGHYVFVKRLHMSVSLRQFEIVSVPASR